MEGQKSIDVANSVWIERLSSRADGRGSEGAVPGGRVSVVTDLSC